MSKWTSPAPQDCQLCHQKLEQEFYDCYVPSYGQWGIVCRQCFKDHRCRTGTGAGQKYRMSDLQKIEG